MNFFKRAFTSIARKPGKPLILLLLIFVLCNIIAGAISVKDALNNTKRSLLEKMGAEVRIEVDWDYVWNTEGFDYSMLQKLDQDLVEKLGSSELVKRTYYTMQFWAQAKNMQNTWGGGIIGLDDMLYSSGVSSGKMIMPVDPDEPYINYASLTLYGGNQTVIRQVENGDISITDGRAYTQEEIDSGAKVILVSKKFAEKNNLSIGSTVTISQTLYNWGDWESGTTSEEVEQDFTVIGIFTPIPKHSSNNGEDDGNQSDYDSEYDNSAMTNNKAIGAFIDSVLEKAHEMGMDDYTVDPDISASFIVNTIDDVELYEAQNKNSLPRGYKFTDNSENLSEIAKPMDNMNLIANIILYVAVGATVLIIALLITLFLKDRTREMGIYLSLGERKFKIAAQILTEVLFVAIIAVTLSVFSGNVLAKQMSSSLLSSQLDETQENNIYYGNDTISGDDFKDEYSVDLNGETVGFIYAVSLGSVLVSTLIPVISTLRLKPRKILL